MYLTALRLKADCGDGAFSDSCEFVCIRGLMTVHVPVIEPIAWKATPRSRLGLSASVAPKIQQGTTPNANV